MPRRATDPFASFNFVVEIEGIITAGFSEATGLGNENNVVEYREGTDSLSVRKLPGLNKYSNIVLKRGMTTDTTLFDWRKNVLDGDIDRRNVTISLLDEAGVARVNWNFSNAWPNKINAPDHKANANEIAIYTLEITHEGMEIQIP